MTFLIPCPPARLRRQDRRSDARQPKAPAAAHPAPASGNGTQTQTQQEALLAAGLCPGEDTIQGIQTTMLTTDALLQVQCATFAYQGKTAFAWVESGQPVRDQDGEILHLIGLPVSSRQTAH